MVRSAWPKATAAELLAAEPELAVILAWEALGLLPALPVLTTARQRRWARRELAGMMVQPVKPAPARWRAWRALLD